MKVRNDGTQSVSFISGGSSFKPEFFDIRPGEEADVSAYTENPSLQAYLMAGVLVEVDGRPTSNSRRRSSGGDTGSAS